MFLSLFLSVVLAASGIPFPGKQKPKFKLSTFPRMALSDMTGRGVNVTFRLTVQNITEQLWCPEVVWSFGEGNMFSSESDCEPFDHVNEVERRQQTYSHTTRLGRGDWVVTVTLRKAGDKIWSDSIKIVIR